MFIKERLIKHFLLALIAVLVMFRFDRSLGLFMLLVFIVWYFVEIREEKKKLGKRK